MTPEQIEMHRKRFEELMMANGVSPDLLQKHQDVYLTSSYNIYFAGYLLCAENIEIELPPRKKHTIRDPSHEGMLKSGFNSCLDEFQLAIESQGIKVRP